MLANIQKKNNSDNCDYCFLLLTHSLKIIFILNKYKNIILNICVLKCYFIFNLKYDIYFLIK